MTRTAPTRIFVRDHSFVGSARRTIRELAQGAGLSGESLGKLDLLSTELSTNLAKHATGGGELLYFDACEGDLKEIRLLSIDRGPGISDLDNVLIDGISTTGTLGAGLGSIKRLSDSFEISSTPGKGTIISCAIAQFGKGNKVAAKNVDLFAISVPISGEQRCGDAVAFSVSEELTSILVVDGLGHGDGAADVAEKAIAVFSGDPFCAVETLADSIHRKLSGTRGAAIALAQIDHRRDQLDFVGVGNIAGRIYTRYASRGCVSVQGIVGDRLGTLKKYTYDWEPGARLLLYSDGIKSAAALSSAFTTKSALVEAAEIYRDFCRITDDTTVLVVKDKRRT